MLRCKFRRCVIRRCPPCPAPWPLKMHPYSRITDDSYAKVTRLVIRCGMNWFAKDRLSFLLIAGGIKYKSIGTFCPISAKLTENAQMLKFAYTMRTSSHSCKVFSLRLFNEISRGVSASCASIYIWRSTSGMGIRYIIGERIKTDWHGNEKYALNEMGSLWHKWR